MHIEIHLFPDAFSISSEAWTEQMQELMGRVENLILDATVNARAAALGKTTLLDHDTNYVVATIDIRRE